MPELRLQRNGDMIDVVFGEHRASVPLADVALTEEKIKRIYEDAVAYGCELFKRTFNEESMRSLLTSLPTNERLVLVAEDPQVAAIPWEYLRRLDGKLLASSLNIVRCVPDQLSRDDFTIASPLRIVVVPASPVDDSRMLNTEDEWQQLVKVVAKAKSLSNKAITLTRVRPPEFGHMGQVLNAEGSTIVHFMGHSDSQDGKGILIRFVLVADRKGEL